MRSARRAAKRSSDHSCTSGDIWKEEDLELGGIRREKNS